MSAEELRKWGCWIPEDDSEPDDSEPEPGEPDAEPEPAEPEPVEPAEPEPAEPVADTETPSDWADRAVEGVIASTLREQLGAWRRTDTELRTRASRSLTRSARATSRVAGGGSNQARAAVAATDGAGAPLVISAPPVTVAAVLPAIVDARAAAITSATAPSGDSSATPETSGEVLPVPEEGPSAEGAYAQSESLQAMRRKFAKARAELHNALSGEEEDLGNPTIEAASPYWNCDVCRFRNREEEDEIADEASDQHRLRHRNASTWFCARCGFARGAVDLPDLSQQSAEVAAGGGAEAQPQLEIVCAPLAVPNPKTEPVDDESRIESEPQPQLEILCASLDVPDFKTEPVEDELPVDSAAPPPLPPHEEAAENPRDEEPPARTFKCAKCARTFTSRVHLRIHGATHARPVEQASALTSPRPTTPSQREVEQPTTTQPERPRTPEEMMPFSCTLCGRKFRNAYHMKTHAAVHRRQAESSNDEMRRMVAEFEANE